MSYMQKKKMAVTCEHREHLCAQNCNDTENDMESISGVSSREAEFYSATDRHENRGNRLNCTM